MIVVIVQVVIVQAVMMDFRGKVMMILLAPLNKFNPIHKLDSTSDKLCCGKVRHCTPHGMLLGHQAALDIDPQVS